MKKSRHVLQERTVYLGARQRVRGNMRGTPRQKIKLLVLWHTQGDVSRKFFTHFRTLYRTLWRFSNEPWRIRVSNRSCSTRTKKIVFCALEVGVRKVRDCRMSDEVWQRGGERVHNRILWWGALIRNTYENHTNSFFTQNRYNNM